MALVAQSTKVEFEFTAMDIVLMGRAHMSPGLDEVRKIKNCKEAMEATVPGT